MSNIANITLDDTSPVYSFIGNWDTAHTGDPLVSSYFRGTFRASVADGDSGTIAFNGTSITCFGAKRPNHGFFNASIDGGEVITVSGEADPDQFQVPLFSSGQLQEGLHTLVLTNANGLNPADKADNVFFDLDYCEYTFSTGEAGTSSLRTIIDDAAPAFTYTGSAWTDNFPAILKEPVYFDRTGHITGGTGDTVSFDFVGTAVQIFGAVNFNHGQYLAELDGIPFPGYDGLYDHLQTSVPLFVATGLTNGSHTVTLKNNGAGLINDLDIDFAVVDMPVEGAGGTTTINAPVATANLDGDVKAPTATATALATMALTGVPKSNASGLSAFVELPSASSSAMNKQDANQSTTAIDSKQNVSTRSVAIALGVIALVLVIAAGSLFLLMRRRMRGKQDLSKWPFASIGEQEKTGDSQ